MHVVHAAPYHLSFFQAIAIGLLQGITEMFPISSLGHSVLVPALIGGSWERLVTQQSGANGNDPYLAFIVGLHVATALALVVVFRRDWVRLVSAFFRTLRTRRITTVDERLAWLLVLGTIPAGITGLLLEHTFRVVFAKPLAAAAFLTINGLILAGGEALRQRSASRAAGDPAATGEDSGLVDPAPEGGARTVTVGTRVLAVPPGVPPDDVELVRHISIRDAIVIGVAQILALFAGISRSGVTMVAGLARGLDNERAIRFAFLLATPIILAAGLVKIPDLAGSPGTGIRGQVLAGSAVAFVAALASSTFLIRYFRTRTLVPFAAYSLLFGVACIGYFA